MSAPAPAAKQATAKQAAVKGQAPSAPAPASPLLASVRALGEAVEAVPPTAPARDDLLADVQALLLEVRRSDLRRDRIRSRLEGMSAHPGLSAACAAVRSHL